MHWAQNGRSTESCAGRRFRFFHVPSPRYRGPDDLWILLRRPPLPCMCPEENSGMSFRGSESLSQTFPLLPCPLEQCVVSCGMTRRYLGRNCSKNVANVLGICHCRLTLSGCRQTELEGPGIIHESGKSGIDVRQTIDRSRLFESRLDAWQPGLDEPQLCLMRTNSGLLCWIGAGYHPTSARLQACSSTVDMILSFGGDRCMR